MASALGFGYLGPRGLAALVTLGVLAHLVYRRGPASAGRSLAAAALLLLAAGLSLHLVPGFASHLIVVVTLAIPGMILAETALSFLQLGLRAPTISWGVLLQDAMNLQAVNLYPWLIWPTAFVVVVVLLFNFLGDGLRDAADPYSH